MKKKCCGGAKVGFVLVILGALNWGLVGLFDWNLVNALLGNWEIAERILYSLIGLSAFGMVFGCMRKRCKSKGGSCSGGSCKSKEEKKGGCCAK